MAVPELPLRTNCTFNINDLAIADLACLPLAYFFIGQKSGQRPVVVTLEQRNLFATLNALDDQLALRLQFSAMLRQAFGHSVAIANALAIGL
jgi:hypothetical protein